MFYENYFIQILIKIDIMAPKKPVKGYIKLQIN
jgi:hypothetical protein